MPGSEKSKFPFMGQIWDVNETTFKPYIADRIQALSLVNMAQVDVSKPGVVDLDVSVDATAIAKDARIPLRIEDGVAIVTYHGPTVRRGDWWSRVMGFTSYDVLSIAIEASMRDTSIVAIVIDMDTPGGTVDGLADFADLIIAAKAKKPVYVNVSGGVYSAGVYVASGADLIVAGQTDQYGNIGSRMMLYDYSAFFEKEGIEAVAIDSGEFKSTGALGTKLTDSQREFLQGVTDFHANDFFGRVGSGRNLKGDALDAVTDGKWWPAPEAIKLGLVDQIGGLRDTIAQARAKGRRSRRGRATAAALATKALAAAASVSA